MKLFLDSIGIANIFEKKECTIDGEKKIYYQCVFSTFGGFYNFANNLNSFIVFRDGSTIDQDNDAYRVVNYSSVLELSHKNDGYNPDQFMEAYHKREGNYYIYDGQFYNQIRDPELLKKIKGGTKNTMMLF